jgi:hypothetical protein
VKYIMIGTACLMVIGIIAGTYFFEKEPNVSKPETPEISDPGPPPLPSVDEAAPVGYSLQQEQLQITYNNGKKWVQVPVEKDNLFQGEHSGSEDELIEDSYILTEDHAAFLYARDYSVDKSVQLVFSKDKGKTWEDAKVTPASPPIRFRKVGFLNESFGYVILSADRTSPGSSMTEDLSTKTPASSHSASLTPKNRISTSHETGENRGARHHWRSRGSIKGSLS